MENSVFEKLNKINVNEHIEQKNGLNYLSWAWAWGELKKVYPAAQYKVYENSNGWNYFTDGRTAWVKTSVIVEGLEHIDYLPIMDFKNKSIPLDQITSFDVNKAIQRSLTKAVARHGLGLYIYAGEDLPEEATEAPKKYFTNESVLKAQNKAETSQEQPTNRNSLLLEWFNLGYTTADLVKKFKKPVAEITDTELADIVKRAKEYKKESK